MHDESSEQGTPGWPDAMTVFVDDFDPEFGALLYSRAAWGLPVRLPLPELLVAEPEMTVGPAPTDESLVDDWEASWIRHCAHVGDFDDFDVEGRGLDALFDAITRRADGLPMMWQDRFATWFDERFEQWSEAARRSVDEGVRPAIRSAFTKAWRTGLDHFSVIPLEGPYAQRLTRRRALVSATTWNDDELMAQTLMSWSAAP